MATVEVKSDRNPDVVYEVDAEAGTCTCPAYTQRLKALNERRAAEVGHLQSMDALVCKHVAKAREADRETA
mgnify:CR=1 FL=1